MARDPDARRAGACGTSGSSPRTAPPSARRRCLRRGNPPDLFGDGPQELAAGLAAGEHPLADVAVNAALHDWDGKLQFAEGQLGAVRQAARLLGQATPQDMARQIARLAARTGIPHQDVFT